MPPSTEVVRTVQRESPSGPDSVHPTVAPTCGGRSSTQLAVPAGTASCAGDLPAQVGAAVGCTLSGPDGVSTWTVTTTSVDGGKIDYSIEQAGPK